MRYLAILAPSRLACALGAPIFGVYFLPGCPGGEEVVMKGPARPTGPEP